MADDVRLDRNVPRLVIGLSIALAGLLFTLDNLRIVHAEDFLSYWPIVLVAIGLAQLVQSRTWGAYIWGLVLVGGGFWILGENLGIVTMSIWKLSPLLLVLLGGSMIWRAVSAPGGALGPPSDSDRFIRGTAVMGGFERTSTSADFRGGDLVAVMGGCKLDLRRATIAGGEAVIDVLAIMGGVGLLIPDTWTVEARILPLMGGVTNRARSVAAPEGAPRQRLILRGTAFMGGVDVKN
jgi:predicted membrane protein